MYNKAKVTGVYDGDSITCSISYPIPNTDDELIKHDKKVRLYGIDTPELRGSSLVEKAVAKEARDYLRSRILDKEVSLMILVNTRDKYGRELAYIYIGEENINKTMIDQGLAREYFGGTKEPWHFDLEGNIKLESDVYDVMALFEEMAG